MSTWRIGIRIIPFLAIAIMLGVSLVVVFAQGKSDLHATLGIAILLFILFGSLMLPVTYLFHQYLKEDAGKIVRLTGTEVQFQYDRTTKRIPLNSISEVIIVGGNTLYSFSFLKIITAGGEDYYVTSLTADPTELAAKINAKTKRISLAFPRLGLKTDGRGEDLADTFSRLIDQEAEIKRRNEYRKLVEYFITKYKAKSQTELEQIINSSQFADYTKEAAQILIDQRKDI